MDAVKGSALLALSLSQARSDLIHEKKQNYLGHMSDASVREFERWLLWAGYLPESHSSVSRSGLYTDFT